jgi:uncharacterized protein Smg (DUF494 family)
MQFLDSLKEVRGIYARWLTFIQGFEFEVVHRPGVKNQNADPLSRMEGLVGTEADTTVEEQKDMEEDVYQIEQGERVTPKGRDEIRRWQRSDPVLRVVMQWVEKGERPKKAELRDMAAEYRAYGGVFEQLKMDPEGGLTFEYPGATTPRLCVPADAYPALFKWAHAHPTAGHFGMNATQKRIRERFFLPGMAMKIVNSISNCIQCVQKRNYVKRDQYVFHRSIESRPFQKVYVDIVGPLVPGEWEGLTVTHIITMMDGFTKWTEATPVADTTAATVAKVLVEQWITRYGVPEQIHSDRGAQFTSEVYTEMLRLLGIQGTVTPPYNPRSNKVERFHRILGEVLRSDQTKSEREWPQKLPLALFAHRTAISTVTGMTPFQAMFGVNSRIPLDVVFPTPRGKMEKWPEYVQGLQTKLQEVYAKVRENTALGIARATALQSGRVNKAIQVTEGDVVYYFSPRIVTESGRKTHKKFALLWTGPYTVKRCLSDSLCIIYPMGEWAKNPREIVTVVDKLRIIRTTIPENVMRPPQQVDLDDIEENLEDYGEYIHQNFPDPAETQIPIHMGHPEAEIADYIPGIGPVPHMAKSTAIRPLIYDPLEMGDRSLGGGTHSGTWSGTRQGYKDDNVDKPNLTRVSSGDIELEIEDGVEEKEGTERSIMDRQSSSISADSQNSTELGRGTVNSPATSRDISIPSSEDDEKSVTVKQKQEPKEEKRSGRSLVTPSTSKGLTQSAPELSEKKKVEEGRGKQRRADTSSAKYHPYPIKRKAAQLAEALIKAGASRERMEEKMKTGTRPKEGKKTEERPKEERKVSSKRKISESQQAGMSGKREKVQVGESEPDRMSDAEEEEEEESLKSEDSDEEIEEGEVMEITETEELELIESEEEITTWEEESRERKGKKGAEEDRKKERIRFPQRVQVVSAVLDGKGRESIPILPGEVKMIGEKMQNGAMIVQKVISFEKREGESMIEVKQYIEEKTAVKYATMRKTVELETMLKTAGFSRRDRKKISTAMETVIELTENREEAGAEAMKKFLSQEWGFAETLRRVEEKGRRELQQLREAMTHAAAEKDKLIETLKQDRAEMGKEISDLKIQYELMGTEMVRLRAQRPGKGAEKKVCKSQHTQTKPGKNTREITELQKRMEKLEGKHRALETTVKRIDGPKSVRLSVPPETLRIPEEWEKCKLVSHISVRPTDAKMLNAIAQEGWCRVETSPEGYEKNVTVQIGRGGDSFKMGALQYDFQLIYTPGEKRSASAKEPPTFGWETDIGEILLPGGRGTGEILYLRCVRNQGWTKIPAIPIHEDM